MPFPNPRCAWQPRNALWPRSRALRDSGGCSRSPCWHPMRKAGRQTNFGLSESNSPRAPRERQTPRVGCAPRLPPLSRVRQGAWPSTESLPAHRCAKTTLRCPPKAPLRASIHPPLSTSTSRANWRASTLRRQGRTTHLPSREAPHFVGTSPGDVPHRCSAANADLPDRTNEAGWD